MWHVYPSESLKYRVDTNAYSKFSCGRIQVYRGSMKRDSKIQPLHLLGGKEWYVKELKICVALEWTVFLHVRYPEFKSKLFQFQIVILRKLFAFNLIVKF